MVFPRVVIVGGGFGGLNVAKGFKNTPFEVIVIDKMNHHLFQPLLYQVATAALTESDIATPIREILRRQKNATVLMAEVVSIDKEKNLLKLKEGGQVAYDYLILSPGSHQFYFGHQDWEERAPGLKTLTDAISIREKILVAFEEAEMAKTTEDREMDLRFAIVGGGPTGVEMAGAIAEISQGMIRDFRKIHSGEAQVYLIEGGPCILPSFPKKLSIKAQKTLEKMGVHVVIGKKVTDITAEGVVVDGQLLKAKTVIWAAGNTASPLLKTLNTPLDRQGRAITNKNLHIPGYPNVFVIGDAGVMEGTDLPAIAPVAIQQGKYLAKRIINGDKKQFRYFDKGQLATIGKTKAVGAVGNFTFSGFTAWLVWSFVHILYLIDFRSRFSVMTEWAFWYLTGNRGSRIISNSIEDIEKK